MSTSLSVLVCCDPISLETSTCPPQATHWIELGAIIFVSIMQDQPCCGNLLCMGCIYAAFTADHRCLCPFCRTPEATSDEEALQRTKKRAEGDDAIAIHQLGSIYHDGEAGLPQDVGKAMELWLRSGELGYADASYNVGNAYLEGRGVERDMKKAKHYWELAAMRGDVEARHNLGCMEEETGNIERAMKHWMISAGAGLDDSLANIRDCFFKGYATKYDFEKALRAHKEAKDEMKSDQREAAAAALQRRGLLHTHGG